MAARSRCGSMPKKERPAARRDASRVALRSITPGDLDEVALLWLCSWESTGIELAPQRDYPQLRQRLEREVAGDWLVTVASSDTKIAGFAAINPRTRRLEQLFVAPGAQRHGVGRALFDHSRRAMPGGFDLWTHGDNVGAARFYGRMGMEALGPDVHPRLGHPILRFSLGPR